MNIGKTKRVAEDEAVADFTRSAQRSRPLADYLVVNVSSPNTPGLRDLQAVDKLRPLLVAVRAACDLASPMRRVPLLVKIAPDLADDDIDAVADLALELGARRHHRDQHHDSREHSGYARARARSRRSAPAGCPARRSSRARSRCCGALRARVGDRLVLIAVGGIETADGRVATHPRRRDARPGYTGFIYGGPTWPRRVN